MSYATPDLPVTPTVHLLMVHGVGGHDHLSNLLRTYQSFRANLESVEAPVEGEDQIPGWRLTQFEEGATPPMVRLEPRIPPPEGGVGAVCMYEVNYAGFASVVRRNQPLDLTSLFVSLDLAVCAARQRSRTARDPVFNADTAAVARCLQRLTGVFTAGTVPIIGLPALLFRNYIGTFVALFTRFFETSPRNLRDDTIYFSPRWKAMLGCSEAEIEDRPHAWFDRIHSSDRDTVKRRIAEHFRGQTPYFEAEARMLHKDGMFRWMLTRGLMIRDESGAPVRMAGSQTDITEGKVADPMTGLPNRLLFLGRLSQVLEHRRRHPESVFAVLFLDLDGFKMVNDSFGHAVGDRLLIQVADRLERSLRHTDTLVRLSESFTFARLGGDEFAILLNTLKDPADATSVAERLLEAFAEPFVVDGNEFFTSASIGIALSALGHHHPEEYVRDADTAMYKAKELGKGRFEVFDADMRATITERPQLETDLRRGLERGELRALYQPIISLEQGDIVGFEALLRWQHPTRGLLQPIDFIPIAEETGMIREIGWWILSEACARITEWRKLNLSTGELTMSVNLSAKQFLQANFSTRLQALIDEHDLPTGTLKLELTESCIMTDPTTSVALLSQIKSLGVRLAIDDFGTGYSSLSYLQQFPLDTLKIDRSFTTAMAADGKNHGVIARTIIPLANQLGLDVVAEGVETVEQAALLKDLECKYAQGFLFSWPLSAEEVQQALAGMLEGRRAGDETPSESVALRSVMR